MKVLIAIPCTDVVEQITMQCVCDLIAETVSHGIEVETRLLANCLIYKARDALANYAIANKFDYVLWVDSDMTFEKDSLLKMLDRIGNKQFLTGLCFSRRPPFSVCIFKHMDLIKHENGSVEPVTEYYDDYPEDEIFPIMASGFAFVLQKVDMLDAMQTLYGVSFFPVVGLGEDLSFCYKANQLEITMYCDSSLKIGHITRIPVDEDFVKQFR